MKGIIVVNDPTVAEYVQEKFPDWCVIGMQVAKPVEFISAPPNN